MKIEKRSQFKVPCPSGNSLGIHGTSMMIGPMVRGVHEDPQRDGSTGTPIEIIGIEDIDDK